MPELLATENILGDPWNGMTPVASHFALVEDIWYDSPNDFATAVPGYNLQPRHYMRWRGWLQAVVAGQYAFRTESDDGSVLYIDGALVVDNDGLHSMRVRDGETWLSEGPHQLVIAFYHNQSPAGLKVSWKPPGAASLEPLPSSSATSAEQGWGAERPAGASADAVVHTCSPAACEQGIEGSGLLHTVAKTSFPSGNEAGAETEARCAVGFSGGVVYRCGSGGVWKLTGRGRCVEQRCSEPIMASALDGTVAWQGSAEGGSSVGASVEVGCALGYSGGVRFTCQEGAHWAKADDPGGCVAVQCSATVPANALEHTRSGSADSMGQALFGTEVTVGCALGFEGSVVYNCACDRAECGSLGRWTKRAGACTAIGCIGIIAAVAADHTLQAGPLASDNEVGATVLVGCEPGFTGNVLYVCGPTGAWLRRTHWLARTLSSQPKERATSTHLATSTPLRTVSACAAAHACCPTFLHGRSTTQANGAAARPARSAARWRLRLR